MIHIDKNNDITCTKNDTFKIVIDSEAENGSQLKFVVAKSSTSQNLIEATMQLGDPGRYMLTVSPQIFNALDIGEYLHKFVVTAPNGDITTLISGNLSVRWGD